MRIKKRLTLFNNLLVLFVGGDELMDPRIPRVLDSIATGLHTPAGDLPVMAIGLGLASLLVFVVAKRKIEQKKKAKNIIMK